MILNHGANSLPRGGNFVEIGGRKYPYVQVGNKLWTTQNLDLKIPGVITIGPPGLVGSPSAWYYNNDESTYGKDGNKYGLIYNYAAMHYINTNNILPDGWRCPDRLTDGLPAINDSTISAYDAKNSEWDPPGSNKYGLNFPPCGFRSVSSDGQFQDVGNYGLWAFDNEKSPNEYYFYQLDSRANFNVSYDYKVSGFYIRLVKDI